MPVVCAPAWVLGDDTCADTVLICVAVGVGVGCETGAVALGKAGGQDANTESTSSLSCVHSSTFVPEKSSFVKRRSRSRSSSALVGPKEVALLAGMLIAESRNSDSSFRRESPKPPALS